MAEYVTTGQAARELGVSVRSLQQWARDGRIVPDLVTPGGHMRWDVARLRVELHGPAALRRRRDADEA